MIPEEVLMLKEKKPSVLNSFRDGIPNSVYIRIIKDLMTGVLQFQQLLSQDSGKHKNGFQSSYH